MQLVISIFGVAVSFGAFIYFARMMVIAWRKERQFDEDARAIIRQSSNLLYRLHESKKL